VLVHPNRSPVALGGFRIVVATSNHYDAVHIEVINFPHPIICGVSYYNHFIVQLSVYVHNIPFTGINMSTVSVRSEILGVAPVDSRGGLHRRDV